MCSAGRWDCHGRRRSVGTPWRLAEDVEISRINLCFASNEKERAFTQNKSEHLRSSIYVQSLLGIVASCGTIALRFAQPKTYASDITEFIILAAWGINLCLAVQTLIVTKILKVWPKLPPKAMEMYAVTTVLIFMISSPFIGGDYAGRLASKFDGSSQEKIPCSDLHLLSCLNIALVGSHFMIPVRCCTLYVTELGVLIVYLGVYLCFGGCEGFRSFAFNFWILGLLVLMTAYGKRVGELAERLYFCKYVNEKVLRFENEHKLSKALTNSKDESSRGVPSQSVPSTTSSDKLFVDPEMFPSEIVELSLKEQWHVDATELEIARDEAGSALELGSGTFGVVFVGHFLGCPVAVKAFIDPINSEGRDTMFNEIRFLRRLRHPNIVQFYGALLHSRSLNLALVMELVTGKPLAQVLETEMASPENLHMKDGDRLAILIDVSCALRYLHSRFPIMVHGDLKSANIVLEFRAETEIHRGVYNPKLLDFGLSRAVTRRARPLGGSIEWIAPEVLGCASHPDPAADVFSFGRLIQHVLTSRLIFLPARSGCSLLQQLQNGEAPQPAWPADIRIDIISNCKGLGENCVNSNSACRPDMSHVHLSLVSVLRKLSGKVSPELAVTEKLYTSNDDSAEHFFAQLNLDVLRSKGRPRETAKKVCPNTALPPKQIPFAEQMSNVDVAMKFLNQRDGFFLFHSAHDEIVLSRSLLSNHECPSSPRGNGSDLFIGKNRTHCVVLVEAASHEISEASSSCIRCGACLSVDSKGREIARVDGELTLAKRDSL